MSLLALSASDVDAIASTFSPEDLQLLMAKVFLRLSSLLGKDSISMPPRIVFPTANHTALFMPARIGPPSLVTGAPISSDPVGQTSNRAAAGDTAIKVVCVPKKSDSRGLPATTLVLDEETGGVKAVVNARKLTALRNAAGSLLSTSLVGPSKPLAIVAFGAGQQVDSHLDLHMRHFPSIAHCTIINRSINRRAQLLCDKLASKFAHVEISLISSSANNQGEDKTQDGVQKAVEMADINICATSSTSPLFPSPWVKAGAHVILIGSYTPLMREVDKDLVLRAIKDLDSVHGAVQNSASPILLVDSREACLQEAGELIDAQVDSEQMTEVGELIPNVQGGNLDMEAYRLLLSSSINRLEAKEDGKGSITMFKSVGVGLQDVAIASAIVDRALSLGDKIGTIIAGYDD